MLLAGIKPATRQTIKARINEDQKNAAGLWIALETEYRIHAADTRMELVRKFATASIDANNVQATFQNSVIPVAGLRKWDSKYLTC
jgi:hypothetical protein